MMNASVEAYEQKRLHELAQKENTTVYTVEHGDVAAAWKADRVASALESIHAKMQSFAAEESDFAVRKKMLEDEEILAFQRRHPKLYYMVTDREKMAVPKYRSAISAMVEVRRRVEAGDVDEGRDADAAATRTVINALSG